jgi:hypothetical protein
MNTNAPTVLSNWDKRLLRQHMDFYHSLHNGLRYPTTSAQRRFVDVCYGKQPPRTKHERAYSAYLRAIEFRIQGADMAQRLQARGRKELVNPPRSQRADDRALVPILPPPASVIHKVRQSVTAAGSRSGNRLRILDQIEHAYGVSKSSLRQVGNEAAYWVNVILADRGLAVDLERLLGAHFNTLSNVYTQAPDQRFLDGLRGLGPMISPLIHRIVDGGHTLLGAFNAVCDALPNDTLGQEIRGCFNALASDLASPAGLPIVTLSKETLKSLTGTLTDALGIPSNWTLDMLTYSAPELLGTSLGVIAATMNWSKTETEEFSRLTAGLGMSTLVSANPLLCVVTLVMLAKAFVEAKNKDEYQQAALGLLKGGLTSGLVLSTGALVGGPVWIGLVAGLCVGAYVQRKSNEISTSDIRRFFEQRVVMLASTRAVA